MASVTAASRVCLVGTDRFSMATAVYAVLIDDERILLMRRAGTGYRDGELSLPAGHLEGGEDAITGLLRELGEELAIRAEPDSCGPILTVHRAPETSTDAEYLDLFFAVEGWSGTPVIGEPGKCSELVWADRHHLPADVIDYVAAAIGAADAGRSLLLYGWAHDAR